MKIQFYFDLLCPWCYLAKLNLNEALSSFPGIVNSFSFSPVQLYPRISPAGKPISYLSDQGVRAKYAHIVQEFELAGHKIDFSKVNILPNTSLPHHLLDKIRVPESRSMLMDILFNAYFNHGLNIGVKETLDVVLHDNQFTELVDEIVLLNESKNTSPDLAHNQLVWKNNSNVVPSFRINENMLNGLITTDKWMNFLKKLNFTN